MGVIKQIILLIVPRIYYCKNGVVVMWLGREFYFGN